MIQDSCKKLHLPKENLSLSDYYLLNKKMNNPKAKRQLKEKLHIKVAILASSTIKGILEVLNVKCSNIGIPLDLYMCDYNQYAQDIIDKKSKLHQFKPDMTVLFIDTKSFLGDYFYFSYRYSDQGRHDFVKDKFDELIGLIKKFNRHLGSRLIVHNFEVPTYSPYGILESRQKFGYFDSIRYINRMLQSYFYKSSNVFIFDYDSFLNRIGKSICFDRKMYYLADMKLHQNLIPALCDEYMRYIKATKSINRKCIILDLDSTLWGGILGEDGFSGIKIGPTAPGNAYVEFQKYLLALFERGIILAINSNNNYKEAIKVIRRHPHMVLREDNFASIKINWENKANNILEIAKEINIGTNSLVYIDDSKQNGQLVKEMLPEVLVVDMPDDASDYAKTIEELDELDWLNITEEDKLRGVMYVREKKRKQFRKNFEDIDEYLSSLQTKVAIKKADKFSIPRISQLTHRTNQFNLTTLRYSESQIMNFSRDRRYGVYFIAVSDRFGDNGISGVVILKVDGADFLIDTFLLSCRVLGRGIEKAVLAFILEQAQKAKLKSILCRYVPTGKNEVAKDFLKNNSFALEQDNKDVQFWSFDLRKKFKVPRFITIAK